MLQLSFAGLNRLAGPFVDIVAHRQKKIEMSQLSQRLWDDNNEANEWSHLG